MIRSDVAELRARSTTSSGTTSGPAPSSIACAPCCGRRAPPLQPVDMNDVVREVVDLARSEVVSRRITVTSTLTPEIPPVLGDRVQLQQVVLNLVLNACDAMSDTHAAKRHLALATTLEDGFVQLVVSDRGVGIPNGPARTGVRAVRDVSRSGPRPRARDQPFDRERAPRIDQGREQRRWRRDVPVLPAGRRRGIRPTGRLAIV